MSELFDSDVKIYTTRVVKSQNMRVLAALIQYQETSMINIYLFTINDLEKQHDTISEGHDVRVKGYPDKYQ